LVLLAMNPSLLSSSLFQVKLALVVIVIANGIYLQKRVSPHLDVCVMKGTKYCSRPILYSTAIFGGLSVSTWYSIVILAFTKNMGYTAGQFIIFYGLFVSAAILIALYSESKSRRWS